MRVEALLTLPLSTSCHLEIPVRYCREYPDVVPREERMRRGVHKTGYFNGDSD